MLDILKTPLAGVSILRPRRFADSRGFFVESWNAARMAQHGLGIAFVQDNTSMSRVAGTVRGLHYQAPPHAQGKLVSCAHGAIFDVAVDVRRGSATHGRWTGVDLTAENGLQLWIPPGFLHGFVTRAPDTVVTYKCTAHYDPAADGAVRWDSCGVDWGLTGPAVLSDKDAAAPALVDWISPFDGMDLS